MTKFTKERLEEIAELARKATYKPCSMHMTNLLVVCDSEVIEEMARQLLASMEQEPVACIDRANLDYLESGADADVWPASGAGSDDVLLYAAPQLPQPAVLSVSEGVLKSLLPDVEKSEFWFEHNGKIFFEGVRFNNAVFEACRAAMLQAGNFREITNSSTNNCREIAETSTNEHEIETHTLLKSIEGMEVSVDVSTCDADAGHRYFGTVTEISELDTAKNGYILLVQDAEPNFDINGNSPVTPGGWISCSDRMPEDTKMLLAFSQGEIVAAYWNWVVNPIDYKKYRAFTYLSGNILDDVTHWMPLPEPPL